MVNVLVTGSKGRLGKLIIEDLKKERNIKVFEFDRGDDLSVYKDKRIHYIIHLAGNYTNDFAENMRDNASLTNNILRLARFKKSKTLVMGSGSIFYSLGEYSLTKAIVNCLVNEYKNMGVDVEIINAPDIWYGGDNIYERIKRKTKEAKEQGKEKVIVDDLDFIYVHGDELSKFIINFLFHGTPMDELNKIYLKGNLWKMFKDNDMVEKGIKKSHDYIDEYGIILKYIQQIR